MISDNAKTQEVSAGRHKRINQNKSSGLGKAGSNSSGNGAEEQSRSTAINRPGRDSARTNFDYGDAPAGKMLQRLDQLEDTHYEYVHAHQTRLRARLDESEKLEQKFRSEAAELRKQILALAIEQIEEEIEPQ